MAELTREQQLEDLLSEGLDLCVRARKIDEALKEKAVREAFPESAEMYPEIYCRSGTPWLWVQEQYDADLAEWEKRARAFLLGATPSDARRALDEGGER